MYQTINGYTIETMKEKIRKYVGENRCTTDSNGYSYQKVVEGVEQRCALGAFLPDDSLPAVFSSGAYAATLLQNHPSLLGAMPLEIKGLRKMQSVHDEHPEEGNVQETLLAWIDSNVENA